MVGRTEQLRVKALLTEAITVLCKNGLRYRNQFSVEGLLGITLDNDDVFLVNINETIGEAVKKAPTPPAKSPPPKKSCAQDSPKIRSEPFSPRRHRKRSNSSCESSPNVKKWRVESDSADEDSKPQVITIKEESVSEDESLQADFAAHVASMQGAITVTPFPNMSGDTDVNSSQSDSLLHDSSQSDSMLPMECFPQQDTFPPVGTLSQTLSIPGALNASSLSASLSVAGCSNWKGAAVPIPQITSDASQGQDLSCPFCLRTYTQKSSRDRHVQSVHLGRKDHQCLFCTKRYTRREVLQRHMRRSHKFTPAPGTLPPTDGSSSGVVSLSASTPLGFSPTTHALAKLAHSANGKHDTDEPKFDTPSETEQYSDSPLTSESQEHSLSKQGPGEHGHVDTRVKQFLDTVCMPETWDGCWEADCASPTPSSVETEEETGAPRDVNTVKAGRQLPVFPEQDAYPEMS